MESPRDEGATRAPMSMDGTAAERQAQPKSPQVAARALVRSAFKGALATLDRKTGAPYASLVTVATTAEGEPLLLISQLALHTQNLAADPRASLLFDGTSATGDPLAGGRVSVSGRVVATDDDAHRRRFLARQPEAAVYAGFADFVFHRLVPEGAHYVGGFGRIVDIAPQHLLTDVAGADALLASEAEIVDHMNADHRDAVALYARLELTRQGLEDAAAMVDTADWRLVALDPDGMDLAARGMGLRVDFPQRVTTPGDARRELVALASAARGASTPAAPGLTSKR